MSAGESSGEQHDATARGNFPQTRWSLVASVRERGERELAAMEELCRVYWPPLYAFARRGGISPEDAADRVQGFFCKVIEKDYFGDADAERGKLRTFLLAAFKHYTANQRKHDHAQRRGGGKRQWLSIDAMEAEMVCAALPANHETPETIYQREWALTVLRSALTGLSEEYEASGRGNVFQILRPYLSWNEAEGTYADAAKELGVSVNTVKSGVSRLRQRYRRTLRAAIADTLQTDSADEIDGEIRHLWSLL